MILEQELKGKTLSPQEVRSILKTDNKEIVELCKRASILPRKNSKGQTYFSYEEVKNLRKVQAMKGASLPPAKTDAKQPSAILNILNSLKEMENKLSNRIAKVIDEKLEGMDEVVVELIRCKTDNETLRQKIIDLNKEIYQLKNDLHSYKPVGLGFYKKKEKHVWE
ncbi:unknown [Clostridium sp. CAG:768]|nr:unknown [Clostridium sp. CAG:768]